MTTARRGFPSGGRDDDRPLGGVPHTTIEESDDGRHWRARSAAILIAGAGAARPEARMRRLKIDAGSPPTEDMRP
jgi:hypothetical protein